MTGLTSAGRRHPSQLFFSETACLLFVQLYILMKRCVRRMSLLDSKSINLYVGDISVSCFSDLASMHVLFKTLSTAIHILYSLSIEYDFSCNDSKRTFVRSQMKLTWNS